MFSDTRIKKVKNKIVTKFNNPEWKQNQYYVTNFLFHKTTRPYLNSLRYSHYMIFNDERFQSIF